MEKEIYSIRRLEELMGYPRSEEVRELECKSEEGENVVDVLGVYSENYPLVVGFSGWVVSSRKIT